MTETWTPIFCSAMIVAIGILAGIFFAFSDFVMKSLAEINPVSGIDAMQAMNRRVYGSLFLILLMGFAMLSAGVAIFAYLKLSPPLSSWIIIGAAIYLIGVMLVTIIFNVPMNQKLDGMSSADAETAVYWSAYLKNWTLWNHVRTIACIGSMACYLGALITVVRSAS